MAQHLATGIGGAIGGAAGGAASAGIQGGNVGLGALIGGVSGGFFGYLDPVKSVPAKVSGEVKVAIPLDPVTVIGDALVSAGLSAEQATVLAVPFQSVAGVGVSGVNANEAAFPPGTQPPDPYAVAIAHTPELVLYAVPLGKAGEATALIVINRAKGLLAEDYIVAQLTKAGFRVYRNISVRTPFAVRRVLDVVVKKGGRFFGLEIKSGGAVKNAAQAATDTFINAAGGTPALGAKAAAAGIDRVVSVNTIYVP